MNRAGLSVLLALCAGACSSHGEEEANADDYFYDCRDMNRPAGLTVYATDEAYREFLDRITAVGLTKDDAQSPQLLFPAPDGTLSLASPPMFSYSEATSAARIERRAPTPTPPRARRARARLAWLKELFSLEGTAWAHCPTVTGPLYLLQLTEVGQTNPAYTALASVTSFTPTKDKWSARLQSLSGKKVKLTLARGVFSTGHLELGPFVSTKEITFTVGP
jgi:hypothetical protein